MRRDEMMLAYVAVTRAQERLDNDGLVWIHDAEYAAQLATPSPSPASAPPQTQTVPFTVRLGVATDPLPEPVCEASPAVAL